MAGHLPAGVAPLLLAVAHRDVDQARSRQRYALAADDLDDFLFLRESRLRACASTARRDNSPQAARPASSWISARESAQLFCAARARDTDDLSAWRMVLLAPGTAAQEDRERSGVETLYGCSAKPGGRRRV